MAMTPSRPSPPRESERVVMLFPRQRRNTAAPPSRRPAIRGVSDYARSEQDDDEYRHRMINNLLAFLVCAVLVVAGVWLVDRIVELRRIQDCALSGRPSCSPVDIPIRSR